MKQTGEGNILVPEWHREIKRDSASSGERKWNSSMVCWGRVNSGREVLTYLRLNVSSIPKERVL